MGLKTSLNCDSIANPENKNNNNKIFTFPLLLARIKAHSTFGDFIVSYISFTAIRHHRHCCHKPSPLCLYVPSRFVAFFLSTQTEATHAPKTHSKLFAHTSCKYLASNRSHISCVMHAFVA